MTLRRSRTRALLSALALAALAAGCNAILGNDDGAVDPSLHDSGGVDVTTIGDGGSAEDATTAIDAEPDTACPSNVLIDPANCGRCGHDCAGGGCVQGVCQPVTLIADGGVLRSIAADDTRVYWTSTIAVMSMSADGGDSKVVYTPQVDEGGTPARIAVGPHDVVWSEVPPIYSQPFRTCPLAGCPDGAVPSQTGDKLGPVLSLAVNADTIYWTEVSASFHLHAVPLDGAPSVDTVAEPVRGIALASDALYWATNDPDAGGFIRRGALDGTSEQNVVTRDAGSMSAVALAPSGAVYWAGGEGIFRREADGGSSPITTDTGYVLGLFPAGDSVYWLEGTNAFATSGQLKRCPASGCLAPETVWPVAVIDVARTSRFIFWIDKAGTLARVAF